MPNSMLDDSPDSISSRLRAIIGDESVAAFARRSRVGEGLLRKYLAGSQPSAQNLLKLADAAGVNLAWLIDGRAPKVYLFYEESDSSGFDASEKTVLMEFRAINNSEKEAVLHLLEALTKPSGKNWQRAGAAIAKVAD